MCGVIRLYGLLFLVNVVLIVIALIDCLSAEEGTVRNLPKVVWAFIILLFSPIGAIVWFVAGRPQASAVGRGGTWRPGSGFPESERPRPRGPDDDPEFLRRHSGGGTGSPSPAPGGDDELFRKWEADLRRREEELQRREREDGTG